MSDSDLGRVAILYPGDLEIRRKATTENNRFATIFRALAGAGINAEPAVYHDDFCDEVREQLMRMDAVLVWMNPIQDGRDRTMLDAMLRGIADQGIYVSTHPDIILKMGTKQVLYETREMGWGSDTHLYRSLQEMRSELPPRLARDGVRRPDAIRAGARLIATNADRYCPVPGGGQPDAAAIIAAIEACTNTRCEVVVGKPSPFTVQAIGKLLAVPMEQCLMIGDRLETDIAMGARAGMATALVLTGSSRRVDLAIAQHQPDYILDTLLDLLPD